MRPMILALLMLSACSDASGPGDESDDPFRQVSVGETRVCAVGESGAGYCWGLAFDDPARSDSVPVRYGGDRSFRQLSPANGIFGDYTCGLAADAGTLCQGSFLVNIDVGGLISSTLAPMANDVPLDTIATSSTHFCGLTDAGAAWCWGDLNAGAGERLGAPTAQLETSAESCGQIPPCAPLALGDQHACMLTTAGEAGDYQSTPERVDGDLRFTSLSAGRDTTCGFTAAGLLYCWGSNEFGQLATGDRQNSPTPVRVRPAALEQASGPGSFAYPA